ncbi:FadR family transcriptional regulator [Mesorhizobium sp. M2D.F.Ca.ET.185.01.1.1]|uniref:FadR/GntR family transcriptional regulator n=1 Tax=unclassified Mesorhizobium TaxID=325217 RepID=UPI000FCA1C61|nr:MULTISPECIES: FadR/GntR family transcriptional regulator [unclassified Mesorhizobium]TGP80621.1 FadR family transcriptional regulator [bacterium M00.F.Ca.ET.227.01.1.1]TGQ00409.1 FadR family transcriptional regulator [bacterium M00.F.Ca.ET.221.01.1.1]TGQ03067.1 FadR family transcriptional regulator [bacterium M00.F.Ca.ET.222.01.1.1]TGU09459.1 FadR family transcriptional regulator [bacterium M00.F.Ca.ET.163.01.1.1]TGU32695.1 FadR family transcriptional regulator [bacterium M00.F.Ca.ET.156.01
MTLKLDKVNRGPHLSTLVASSISREIAQGRLKPGDQLPTEQALATTFGVSRNVVREAIARLRSEGRIWSQQGRGAFVADAANATVLTIDYETLQRADSFRNLFELRGVLEVQIAALAASRRSDADIAAMEQALDGMRTAPYGSVAWLKNDLGFHRAVAEATQNPYMGQFLVFVSERVRESILAAGNQQKSDDMARTTLGEHERILAAIKAGDAKGASAAMTRHLAGAASRVGLPGGEASAKPASPARHSRLRKAVRGQAAG